MTRVFLELHCGQRGLSGDLVDGFDVSAAPLGALVRGGGKNRSGSGKLDQSYHRTRPLAGSRFPSGAQFRKLAVILSSCACTSAVRLNWTSSASSVP